MLQILLGPDGFSKKQYCSALAKDKNAQAEFFVNEEPLPKLEDFCGQDLFAKTRVVILQDLLGKYEYSEVLANKLIASNNYIIFQELKVDKRLTSNKQWLGHKNIEIKDFSLPHGSELNTWIMDRVADLGGRISEPAALLLAKKMGRDEAMETKFGGKVVEVKEIFDLWQADSEIQKLLAFAEGKEIGLSDVEALAFENGEVDALKITNAIGSGNKDEALNLVGHFLSQGGDEKPIIIQLNALLSEQFRNIYLLQDLLGRKITESEILEKTGWKSGRLFILKKIAVRFPAVKVKDLLNKLSAFDEEIKSTSTPPRVVLDLILTQLFL